jgi:protein SCO1
MPQKFWTAVLAVVALLAGLLAASYVLTPPQGPALRAGMLPPPPRALPDFRLTNQDGQPFTPPDLQGHWSLVFAGFTHCPDICPTTLAQLKTLHGRLREQQRPLNVIFLSIDPDRDGPAQLSSYVRYFDPSFTGVTAPEPELARFTRGLMLTYLKVPGASPESYSMDHSAALALLDPQGRLAGFFSPPFQLDDMTADLAQLIPASS